MSVALAAKKYSPDDTVDSQSDKLNDSQSDNLQSDNSQSDDSQSDNSQEDSHSDNSQSDKEDDDEEDNSQEEDDEEDNSQEEDDEDDDIYGGSSSEYSDHNSDSEVEDVPKQTDTAIMADEKKTTVRDTSEARPADPSIILNTSSAPLSLSMTVQNNPVRKTKGLIRVSYYKPPAVESKDVRDGKDEKEGKDGKESKISKKKKGKTDLGKTRGKSAGSDDDDDDDSKDDNSKDDSKKSKGKIDPKKSKKKSGDSDNDDEDDEDDDDDDNEKEKVKGKIDPKKSKKKSTSSDDDNEKDSTEKDKKDDAEKDSTEKDKKEKESKEKKKGGRKKPEPKAHYPESKRTDTFDTFEVKCNTLDTLEKWEKFVARCEKYKSIRLDIVGDESMRTIVSWPDSAFVITIKDCVFENLKFDTCTKLNALRIEDCPQLTYVSKIPSEITKLVITRTNLEKAPALSHCSKLTAVDMRNNELVEFKKPPPAGLYILLDGNAFEKAPNLRPVTNMKWTDIYLDYVEIDRPGLTNRLQAVLEDYVRSAMLREAFERNSGVYGMDFNKLFEV